MQEKSKNYAQSESTGSVIALGKSKRLAALRKSVEVGVEARLPQHKPGANKKDNQVVMARIVIRERVADIKATYPQGMQNKLFALRYGSDEKINQMSLQKLYILLGIKQRLAKEIANLELQDKNINSLNIAGE